MIKLIQSEEKETGDILEAHVEYEKDIMSLLPGGHADYVKNMITAAS